MRKINFHRLPFAICHLLLFTFSLPASEAEPSFERGVVLIRNELGTANGFRALAVAVRPGEEDAETLAYLRNTLGVETHVCFLTRGEGTLNEGGPEAGAALAVRRTQEAEAACRILGAKAWYLNLPDLGRAKSPEQTLKTWGHDEALARLVRLVRMVRPHLVFAGHSQTAETLLIEAFDAAADAAKFPEQMKADGTQPWAISKLYGSASFQPARNEGGQDARAPGFSRRDTLSGLSAVEIAAFAFSKYVSLYHPFLRRGEERLLKSRAPKVEAEKNFVGGLEPQTTPETRKKIDKALNSCGRIDFSNCTASAGLCFEIFTLLEHAAQAEPSAKEHLQRALVETLGVKIEATSSDPVTTYDEPVTVTLRVSSGGAFGFSAKLKAVPAESEYWQTKFDESAKTIAPGEVAEFKATVQARVHAYPTFPPEQYIFSRMEARTPLHAVFSIEVPPAQDRPQPVSLTVQTPIPLELALPRESYIRPDPVLVFDDPAHGDDFLVLAKFRLAVINRRRLTAPLKLFCGIQPQNSAPVDRWATLVFNDKDEVFSEEFHSLVSVEALNKSDVLIPTSVWTAEENFGGPAARIRRVPVKLPPRLNVGLVQAYSGAVASALAALANFEPGLNVKLLAPEDLRTSDLNQFNTIILDFHSAHDRPELRRVKARLAQFMNDGGNVVWLKGEGSGGEEEDFAPYPIKLFTDSVAAESAPVRILRPEHPLLREPCKIWERDFENWVVERGESFPEKWAPQYSALLACGTLEGGLLAADVGRGSFIYTSFAWPRQLQAGIPGAYRMLANLISYSRRSKK